MKKPAIIALLVVLLFCLVGALGLGYSMFSSRATADKKIDELISANSIVIDEGEVVSQVIETGPLEAKKTVEIKSRVQGRIKQLLVDEGDLVQEGQLVAVIDPQETELQVRQQAAQLRGAESGVARLDVEIAQRRVTAQTNLARNRSRLRQLEMELKQQPILTNASIRSSESALASARQSLDLLNRVTHPNTRVQVATSLQEADAALTNAEIELARRRSLLDKGYISRREFEQAELSLTQAKTRKETATQRSLSLDRELRLEVAQAQERIQQAEQDLTRAKANAVQDRVKAEELRQAQQSVRDAETALKDVIALQASRSQQLASVDQLKSVLSDAQRQLGETEIRSPVTGVITKRFVQLGELVSSLSSFSSGTPIFRVEDRSAMKVKLQINEIDVARLQTGTPAEIRVDAFPNEKFAGSVTKIAPASISASSANPAAGGVDPVVKYEVEVTLAGSPSTLKSGMSAQCTMKNVNLAKVLRVRRDFVFTNDKGETFVEVTQNPRVLDAGKDIMKQGRDRRPKDTKEVQIVVGQVGGQWAEVKSGVKAGDKLWKPRFSGPNRKTFFSDGDEQQRAEEEKKKEEAQESEEAGP